MEGMERGERMRVYEASQNSGLCGSEDRVTHRQVGMEVESDDAPVGESMDEIEMARIGAMWQMG